MKFCTRIVVVLVLALTSLLAFVGGAHIWDERNLLPVGAIDRVFYFVASVMLYLVAITLAFLSGVVQSRRWES